MHASGQFLQRDMYTWWACALVSCSLQVQQRDDTGLVLVYLISKSR
jgi:hypothetical protein